MAVDDVIKTTREYLGRVGKAGMNVKFPDEFELYIIALELIDSKKNTLRYFMFPVMPNTLEDTITQVHNIKKTLGGVTVLSTTGFIPSEVNIQGSFGRKFRILLGGSFKEFIASFKDTPGKMTKNSFKKGVREFFDDRVKTGYGSCKVLQSIIEESNTLDDSGGVKTLILHNLALGNSYIVKPSTLKFSMSQETNMIWNYNLPLRTIAPLSALYSQEELKKKSSSLVLSAYMQPRVDNLVNKLKGLVS